MPKYLISPPSDSGWMVRYVDYPNIDQAWGYVHGYGYPEETRVLQVGGDFDVVTDQPHPAEHERNVCAHAHNDATDVLLEERAKTHGSFHDHARYTWDIKRVVKTAEAEREMRGDMPLIDTEREALHMIAHKIGRILAGKSDFADHWDDIAGYARLVSRALSQQP